MRLWAFSKSQYLGADFGACSDKPPRQEKAAGDSGQVGNGVQWVTGPKWHPVLQKFCSQRVNDQQHQHSSTHGRLTAKANQRKAGGRKHGVGGQMQYQVADGL